MKYALREMYMFLYIVVMTEKDKPHQEFAKFMYVDTNMDTFTEFASMRSKWRKWLTSNIDSVQAC